MTERIVTTFVPIRGMEKHTQEGYARKCNEAIAAQSPVAPGDLISQEKRAMLVDRRLTHSMNKKVEGCTNDCWLRAVVKQDDSWPREGAEPGEERTESGPSFKLYCLPDGIMRTLPPEVQAEICAERHAAARSEFDHLVAPSPTPQDFEA